MYDIGKNYHLSRKNSSSFLLYVINDQFYFGEMTFYPNSGFGTFHPEEWNYKIGSLLNLPNEVV